MASPVSAGFSAYYHTLDDSSKMRYREKLSKLGGLKDPYLTYTKDQAQSKIWFQQRAGSVTASRLKAAVCTDKHNHQNHYYKLSATQKAQNLLPKL